MIDWLNNSSTPSSGQRNPTYHNTLALVYYRAGNYDMAIESANQSLKLNRTASVPFDWLILELLSRTEMERQDPSALSHVAMQELLRAKECPPRQITGRALH